MSEDKNTVLFIESKFLEYLDSGSVKFSDSYGKKESYYEDNDEENDNLIETLVKVTVINRYLPSKLPLLLEALLLGVWCKLSKLNEVVKITGVERLKGCFHEVIPDRIEAGTYLIIGALCGENLKIDNIIPEHIESLTSKMLEMGANLEIGTDYIIVSKKDKYKSI